MRCGRHLVGMHDFKSFATAKPEVTDTVRTIYETSLEKEDDLIRFRITGNGFLYNMVRIITGTLLEVGKGDYPPEKVKEILAAKDRKMAGNGQAGGSDPGADPVSRMGFRVKT